MNPACSYVSMLSTLILDFYIGVASAIHASVKFRLSSGSQVVPEPHIDKSGNNIRIVSRPPINQKAQFVKIPTVQPADLKQPPATPPGSSKTAESQRTPFQRLTCSGPKSPTIVSRKKQEKPQNQSFQQGTPGNEVGATTSAAPINSYLEPAAQSLQPSHAKSAESSKQVLEGASFFPTCWHSTIISAGSEPLWTRQCLYGGCIPL